jgi:lipopolysaccharide/colanic/teichoic acid biosynthesis glycosyltransferase
MRGSADVGVLTVADRGVDDAARRPFDTRTSLAKEVLERVLAVALLAVLALPMLAVAMTVRLTSPGPAIYRQTRLGRGARPFSMWKFRTMTDGADRVHPGRNDADGLLFKVRHDPRVTRVGRFLRRWSIDELPQLINILRGEMALVGPRPLPVPLSEYDGVALRRLAVKPGLTGLWQVSGRSDTCWDECLSLDLAYIESWSLRLDLRILASTVAAVLRRHGAYCSSGAVGGAA